MTPAERIRKLVELAEDISGHLTPYKQARLDGRMRALRECLAIVEEAERARDDA